MTRRTLVAVAAALLVPAVAGAVALASFDDRADQVDQVRAAVVNLDEAVTITDPETGEDQPVLAGRLLAGELTTGDDALLGWELTDADDAETGLEDGTFQAAITIPADFSAAATSVQGDDPQQATIQVQTAEAGSPLAAVVGQQVAAAAAGAVGDQLTTQYLDQVLLGFGGLETQLGSASDGAADLAHRPRRAGRRRHRGRRRRRRAHLRGHRPRVRPGRPRDRHRRRRRRRGAARGRCGRALRRPGDPARPHLGAAEADRASSPTAPRVCPAGPRRSRRDSPASSSGAPCR